MQLRLLDHFKRGMKGIETIGDITNYRHRRFKQQSNINYKSDDDPTDWQTIQN